jgi:hypothetical protein
VIAEREGEPGKRGGGKWFWRLPEDKVANLKDWQPKSAANRTDSENTAYSSRKTQLGLRLPNRGGVNGASQVGNLNQPLSADFRSSESATLEVLRTGGEGQLSSHGVRELFSKPPQWLQNQADHCRRQGAPRSQMVALANAVAFALCKDSTRGSEVLATVEAQFHPLDCECGECV